MNENEVKRHVLGIHPGMPTSDGAGVQLRRFIGTPELSIYDPFLLLDVFHSDDPGAYIAGFPPHPHRGFETVTYLIAGRMRHRDSRGNEGLLGPGSVQWMTAGRGIIHSEMPEQEHGLLRGTQLWVNLPGRLKMVDPAYQDIPADRFPDVALGQSDDADGTLKVIAGTYGETTGPTQTHIPIHYFDVELAANRSFHHSVPETWNVFVLVLEGDLTIGNRRVPTTSTAFLSRGREIEISAGEEGSRFLLIGGEPIGEPVARGGPFVMNTKEEVLQAFYDYEAGRLDA